MKALRACKRSQGLHTVNKVNRPRPSSNRRAIEFSPPTASLLVSAAKIIENRAFRKFTSRKAHFARASGRELSFVFGFRALRENEYSRPIAVRLNFRRRRRVCWSRRRKFLKIEPSGNSLLGRLTLRGPQAENYLSYSAFAHCAKTSFPVQSPCDEFSPPTASLLVSAAKIVLFQRFEEFTSEKRYFESAAARYPLLSKKVSPVPFSTS
jgi:hypothetical protein